MLIQFSTTSDTYAKQYLAHESFKHLDENQKTYILNNLGKVRVLDPMMHGGGKLSFSDNQEMTDFCKIGTHNPVSFMFNCSYVSLNLELIKFGLAKGYPYDKLSLGKVIDCNNQEILDYYLQEKLVTPAQVISELESGKCSFEFFKTNYPRHAQKIEYYSSIVQRFTASEVLELCDLKLLAANGIVYADREKHNQVIQLKKMRNKKNRLSHIFGS